MSESSSIKGANWITPLLEYKPHDNYVPSPVPENIGSGDGPQPIKSPFGFE
jgi:hypothetical protein